MTYDNYLDLLAAEGFTDDNYIPEEDDAKFEKWNKELDAEQAAFENSKYGKALKVRNFVMEMYNQGMKDAMEGMDADEAAVKKTIGERLDETIVKTKEKAGELKDSAKVTADNAKASAIKLAGDVKTKAGELKEVLTQKIKSLWAWAKSKLDAAIKAADAKLMTETAKDFESRLKASKHILDKMGLSETFGMDKELEAWEKMSAIRKNKYAQITRNVFADIEKLSRDFINDDITEPQMMEKLEKAINGYEEEYYKFMKGQIPRQNKEVIDKLVAGTSKAIKTLK